MSEAKVRMSTELFNHLFTRDHNGRKLRVEWGEPDADGFYLPTIHTEDDDRVIVPRHNLRMLIHCARYHIDHDAHLDVYGEAIANELGVKWGQLNSPYDD